MAIEVKEPLLHWNYFLALANDLEEVSRFIEFGDKNFKTYSIELAHLLLASASEVDVVAKGVCAQLKPRALSRNIEDYRRIIIGNMPEFSREEVFIPRYNIVLRPWSNWNNGTNPLWWRSYNNVKHQRNDHFEEANLKNALNSLGALLIAVFYFYKLKFGVDTSDPNNNMEVTMRLKPESGFLRLQETYYYEPLWVGHHVPVET